jgi:hypothetical protein
VPRVRRGVARTRRPPARSPSASGLIVPSNAIAARSSRVGRRAARIASRVVVALARPTGSQHTETTISAPPVTVNHRLTRLGDQTSRFPGPEPIRSLGDVQATRAAVQLGQVLPRGRFGDLEPVRGHRDRPGCDVGAQDLQLAPGRSLADGRHDAERLRVAASHSALPRMDTRTMVVCLCLAPVGRVIVAFTRRTTPGDRHRTAGGCLSPLGGTTALGHDFRSGAVDYTLGFNATRSRSSRRRLHRAAGWHRAHACSSA